MASICWSASQFSKLSSLSLLKVSRPTLPNFTSSSFSVRCAAQNDGDEVEKKRLSNQSSWETKDAEGRDYLYRLGQEADNMNIAVGQRAGVIDDLFAGNFLGKDCNNFFLDLLRLVSLFSFRNFVFPPFSCSGHCV